MVTLHSVSVLCTVFMPEKQAWVHNGPLLYAVKTACSYKATARGTVQQQEALRPLRTTLNACYISQGKQLLRLQGGGSHRSTSDAKNAPNSFWPVLCLRCSHSPPNRLGRKYPFPTAHFIRRLDLSPSLGKCSAGAHRWGSRHLPLRGECST